MKPSDAIATQSQMQQQKVCVVMPTYNNGGTLRDVVERVLAFCADVIVVNDGCTDDSADILASMGDRITVVDYGRNRGKGYALKQGFKKARQMGFNYAMPTLASAHLILSSYQLQQNLPKVVRSAVLVHTK